MKIITITSTRPELIRLSLIIKKLDALLKKDHILIHTKQNFTKELNENFFEDLNIRKPDFELNYEKKVGFEFGGECLNNIYTILSKYDPKIDKILILGDVNGAFYSAYVAKKMGFKIFHMEAGNRCYDDNVPEEVNRRAIDSFSYKLLTYTQRSRENLIAEGYKLKDIIVVGNPIFEVIEKIKSKINLNKKKHIIITFHRNENVSNLITLKNFINQINLISKEERIYLSVHPKLESMLKKHKNNLPSFESDIVLNKPFRFNEFIELEANAKCVITDSGTIPEECSIFNTPCILVRDSTERPELLEVNQMIISKSDNIYNTYKKIALFNFENIPEDYYKNTSEIVSKLLIGDL